MAKKDDGKVGAETVAGIMRDANEGAQEQSVKMIATLERRLEAHDVSDATAGRWRTFERLFCSCIALILVGIRLVHDKLNTKRARSLGVIDLKITTGSWGDPCDALSSKRVRLVQDRTRPLALLFGPTFDYAVKQLWWDNLTRTHVSTLPY